MDDYGEKLNKELENINKSWTQMNNTITGIRKHQKESTIDQMIQKKKMISRLENTVGENTQAEQKKIFFNDSTSRDL